MSRIGKQPVVIPEGVKCELAGSHLKVTGPKGTLERHFHPSMTVEMIEGRIIVKRPNNTPEHRALHGLTRALIANMVTGVAKGFEKVLTIHGVGYRASMHGKALNLALGFSHPVVIEVPEGIKVTLDNPQTIRLSGIDKELLGQTAADIRAWRKPEPYKGKGIRYADEYVRRKVGKAGATAAK